MSHVLDLHEEAMDLAEEALRAQQEGQSEQALHFSRLAFERERAAAALVQDDIAAEPTRSVLLRSAATLALECGELDEAKHLVALGLAGTPPPEIRLELQELAEQLQRTGKQSLDVGADRIARTTYAALAMLQALRERTGQPIPLVWSPAFGDAVGAIEVYPAATLAGYGVRAPGYKRPDQPEARRTVAAFLTSHLRLQVALDTLLASDHTIDAALCCVAGLDVLHGRAVSPTDAARAAKEGWIWFRAPGEHA